jgi:hypothetical protein
MDSKTQVVPSDNMLLQSECCFANYGVDLCTLCGARPDHLFPLLEEKGAALWECDLAASDRAKCPECGTIFERTTSSRQYCGDTCRAQAKNRRWRQNDPERARQAQAKHYRTTCAWILPSSICTTDPQRLRPASYFGWLHHTSSEVWYVTLFVVALCNYLS